MLAVIIGNFISCRINMFELFICNSHDEVSALLSITGYKLDQGRKNQCDALPGYRRTMTDESLELRR